MHLKRDGFMKRKDPSAIERHEFLSVDVECRRHHGAFWPARRWLRHRRIVRSFPFVIH
jgi:hypothetical protein